MMKVFDILTPFNYSQTHSVVAESMAKAEETFLKEYPFTEIKEIRLHSVYVQIQDAPQKAVEGAGEQQTTGQS